MKKVIKTLDHIFDILFLTYPKPYREEYGLEIQGVFRQIIHAAAQKNTLQLARATFRELRDYPITLFREYRQNYLQKELAIVTNTPSLSANGCPRCGSIKGADARYCLNCGLAFIPFSEYILEQVKNFFNSKVLLLGLGIVSFLLLSWISSDRILFHGFFPATNVIVIGGVALLSYLASRRLFGNAANFKKLGSLLIIVVISLGFLILSSELDELYLRNTLTAENPLSYKFLDSETYVAYVEEKQAFYTEQRLRENNWMQMYIYLPPYDKLDHRSLAFRAALPYLTIKYSDPIILSFVSMPSSQTDNSPFDSNHFTARPIEETSVTILSPYDMYNDLPAIVIERSWASKDYYGLFLMLFIGAGVWVGSITAKKSAKEN